MQVSRILGFIWTGIKKFGIWAISMGRETVLKRTVEQWQGENLLGCALMEVRDWLRGESLEWRD